MRELLFVDDDASIVGALGNVVRRNRDRWHVRFANSAADAVRAMRTQPAEVIVTDLSMPDADGANLLARVKRDWPATVRIVLSGQPDDALARSLVHLAHLFIAKPVASNQLLATLDRVCAVLDTLKTDELRRLVGSLGKLPVLSRTSKALQLALTSPDKTARQISAIVEESPTLTAKILHLGNSAFFAASQRVVTVERAVTVIGLETLQALVLAADLFAPVPSCPGEMAMLERLKMRSLFAARLARAFSPAGKPLPNAWTAALLHDVGLFVIVAANASLVERVRERMVATGETLMQAELALWGATHANVGAYLLGLWGLEWEVVAAVNASSPSSGSADAASNVCSASALTAARSTDAAVSETMEIVSAAVSIADEFFPLFPDLLDADSAMSPTVGEVAVSTHVSARHHMARTQLLEFLENRSEPATL